LLLDEDGGGLRVVAEGRTPAAIRQYAHSVRSLTVAKYLERLLSVRGD
jgi:hypothetical protein